MKKLIFFKKIKIIKIRKRRKKQEMLKRFLKVLFVIILFFIVAVDIMFFVELRKTNGNSVKAAVRSFKKCC